jgi:glycerol-3-phosphate cytidylyltransferase
MYSPLADSHKSPLYKKLKERWPATKDITAFTAGNFDIIHPGYTATFEEAKRHCDKFIVFLHGDPSATRNTKYKPIVPYYDRYKMLMSIKHIDEVYMYQTEEELHHLMKTFDLHVRILGEDYLGKSFTGDDLKHEVIYTTRSHEWSTTKFKNRIAAMTMIQNEKLREKMLAILNDQDTSEDILNGDFTQLER